MKQWLATELKKSGTRKEMNREAGIKWEKVTENNFAAFAAVAKLNEITFYDKTYGPIKYV